MEIHGCGFKLTFPNVSWFNEDESSLSQQMKDTRCTQLQEFLRGLCNLVYTENIDESTSEIALFVQTFLGCDTEINSEHDFRRNNIDFHFRGSKSETENKSLLKKALQLYTYLSIVSLANFQNPRGAFHRRCGATSSVDRREEKGQCRK